MKRRDLIRHLKQRGCTLLREGGNQLIFCESSAKKISTIPRHRDEKHLFIIISSSKGADMIDRITVDPAVHFGILASPTS